MEAAKIYKKEATRPLTQYQKGVNEEAAHLVLNDPSLLSQRGELMILAQSRVYQKGYRGSLVQNDLLLLHLKSRKDQNVEEIRIVAQQKRELSEELSKFREKERKSKWYQKNSKKRSLNARASDESDFPLSSPGSSIASTSLNAESIHIESDTELDTEMDAEQPESVFPPGLPADN